MQEIFKWVGGATAAGVWLFLVLEGKTDAAGFVDFLKAFLVGVGAYGLTVSGRSQ